MRDWALSNSVSVFDTETDLLGAMKESPFDFLFSVVSRRILPAEILSLPRRGAINFHDGPLPRYAGLHATSWALIHREASHGVTWHLMNELLDGGEVLKQRKIDIEADETAFSLNTKCLEVGSQTFRELVDELAHDTAQPRRQDLSHRSYFGAFRRPEAACVISFQRRAVDIAALVRALDTGEFPNPLGRAKIHVDGVLYLCPEVTVVETPLGLKPGTVFRIGEDGVGIATSDGGLEIKKLLSMEGVPLEPVEVARRHHVIVGSVLPELEPELSRRLTELNAELSRYESYWVERLRGIEHLSIPYFESARGEASKRGVFDQTVPEEVVALLGESSDATSFMLAAFTAYLARLSGQQTFDIGVRLPCRGGGQALPTQLTSDVVPLKVDIDADTTFAEERRRLQNRRNRWPRQQAFARDVVVRYPELRHLAGQGAASWLPVQTEFVDRLGQEATDGDFVLRLVVSSDAPKCRWLYDTAVVTEDNVQRMAKQFTTLLREVASRVDRTIASLPLLDQAERRLLLEKWNATHLEFPSDLTVHDAFERQVASTPDVVAVVVDDQELSYRELNARANQLARHLRGLGVGPETLVGISLDRSLELVVGLLGILKAGGAYVPLDPEYPRDRIAFMLEDSRAPVLLTQERLAASLPVHPGSKVICLDSDWPEIRREREENPASEVKAENLAYVIYTSGSTGTPKGAMITHRAICNRLLWMQGEYRLSSDDTVLQKTPFSFDVSVWEFFWPLMTGARMVLARPGGHMDAAYLARLIAAQSVTVMHFVPSMLRVFLEEKQLESLGSLRHVFCSGEALSFELQQRFFARLGADLHNLYGPTEAAVDVTYWQCERDSDRETVPIGRPVANTRIYLLDADLRPVPIGLPGELHIGGVQVARGYYKRDELTAERFIQDPFANEGRLYKTGDLARFLPDGNIEFLGRIDHQVKVRGFRIELGEIEATLLAHPAVDDAVLVAREDEPGETHLVAYVVRRGETRLDGGALRSFLHEKLPDYMVPAAFVELDALPLTPNGKVDRKALPAPDRTTSARFVAPRNEFEKMVAGIWGKVLGLDRVGAHDDFFELGGQSLVAIRVVSRILENLNVELSVRDVFEAPTVAKLARRIEQQRGGGGPLIEPIRHVPRDGELPLSFGQQRLWFLDRLNTESVAYNLCRAVRLRGALSVTALERSVSEVVRRHESLRTTFPAVDGRPTQKISGPEPCSLRVIDLEGLSDGDREAELRRLATEEARRPFELAQGPLLRIVLVRLGEDEHALLVVMHHIVSDGLSLGHFERELEVLYASFSKGLPSPLPELPIQYVDYAHWQREWLQGEVREKQLRYWKKKLGEKPPVLNLPVDRPRPAIQTYFGAKEGFTFPKSLLDGLNVLSRREDTTLFMTLVAAFTTLLYRYTDEDDVVVGTPIAGRSRTETEDLIGLCINMLALRTDLSGNPSFRELLRRVREVVLGAFAHQDLPFEQLIEALQPERDLSHSPLFQVMLAIQDVPMELGHFPGVTSTPLEIDNGASVFDMSLFVWESDDELRGTLEYNTDLFDRSTIVRLLDHLKLLLEGAVADPDRRLSELPLLPESESARLLLDWNDTRTDYVRNSCIHEQFEAQVERTPEAVAITVRGEQLTYRELSRRANQLAHRLRGLGVGPEVLVGICADRSMEMVVALLGVLKAGGAYVPLDPTFPKDRLALMVEDSALPVIVVQSSLEARLPEHAAKVVRLESGFQSLDAEPGEDVDSGVTSESLSYVMYTSGSTGRPKGVMLEHRNVVNFFAGMDERIEHDPPGVWLAVTTISFDISVLELLWTLARGFKVVLYTGAAGGGQRSSRPVDFSLFYFASDESEHGHDKYRLLMDGAKFADRNGFAAVWTPERHFNAFGGLYPNPSVISAALAAVTDRIGIRAGSVVLPLHSPIRVVEEWSLVDNLSGGRVALSVASGWHPHDFVIRPESFANSKALMFDQVETVRRLWRGEAVSFPGPDGEPVEVRTLPRPVQSEVPIWVTAAGNPETFRVAGKIGANVLTHLLGQRLEDLAEKIRVYREAREAAGLDPAGGCVTLMLHTFVGDDVDEVREIVRGPMKDYLRSSMHLILKAPWSLPAPWSFAEGMDHVFDKMSPEDVEALLDYSFERYFDTSGLFGTPASCEAMVHSLMDHDIDEVACLIDFGVPSDLALDHLKHLGELRERFASRVEKPVESIPALIDRHGVTHFQCTPSMAGFLILDPETRRALGSVKTVMVGGEALPGSLAKELKEILTGRLINMYGPTETTIWSSTHEVTEADGGPIPIGRPIANTRLYVVDRNLRPVPIGVSGELLIGGDGTARGYLNRPELTEERFVPDPFVPDANARLYRTGDLVRYRAGGDLEFLGRTDHQVKIRGYRIELGEIESLLLKESTIKEAVVLAREIVAGDLSLVAYVVPREGEAVDVAELKARLAETLPAYMVPLDFVAMTEFPLTPNGKIDRKGLPSPTEASCPYRAREVADADAAAADETIETSATSEATVELDRQPELEKAIAKVWSEALQLPRVGREDNFFDLGGHSLLAVQVQHLTRQALRTDIQLADIFAYPTVRKLATYLGRSRKPATVEAPAEDRSQLRQSLSRRRNLRQKIRTSTGPAPADNDNDSRSRGAPFVAS